MIPATVDAWLDRFAAGAGPAYVWTWLPYVIDGRIRHQLRALLTETQCLCPISAEATFETGRMYLVTEWRAAARQQGLGALPPPGERWRQEDRFLLMDAADDDPGCDPAIRARLARICRVGEEGASRAPGQTNDT